MSEFIAFVFGVVVGVFGFVVFLFLLAWWARHTAERKYKEFLEDQYGSDHAG